MADTQGTFPGARGLSIFYRCWHPPGGIAAAKAGMVVIHGAAEHSGRYEHVGERYKTKGYAVWALDLPGLGQSGGLRGHVERFADYLADVRMLVRMVRDLLPGGKVFLLGHSKGGLITLAYAEEDGGTSIDGAAVSAPLLAFRMRVPPAKAVPAKILAGIFPRLSARNQIDPAALARNPEVGRRYMADPLLCQTVTFRYFTELLRAMDATSQKAGSLARLPILMMQGSADRIVDPDATRRFYDRLTIRDKEFQSFDGFYHELFNEDDREQVFAVLDGWLERHLTA